MSFSLSIRVSFWLVGAGRMPGSCAAIFASSSASLWALIQIVSIRNSCWPISWVSCSGKNQEKLCSQMTNFLAYLVTARFQELEEQTFSKKYLERSRFIKLSCTQSPSATLVTRMLLLFIFGSYFLYGKRSIWSVFKFFYHEVCQEHVKAKVHADYFKPSFSCKLLQWSPDMVFFSPNELSFARKWAFWKNNWKKIENFENFWVILQDFTFLDSFLFKLLLYVN